MDRKFMIGIILGLKKMVQLLCYIYKYFFLRVKLVEIKTDLCFFFLILPNCIYKFLFMNSFLSSRSFLFLFLNTSSSFVIYYISIIPILLVSKSKKKKLKKNEWIESEWVRITYVTRNKCHAKNPFSYGLATCENQK